MAQEMTEGRKKALYVISVVLDAIKESGPDGIPSGHLYSMLMNVMSLETYQGIINWLERGGKIRISNHLLTFIEG